jgi:DNA-directed RNA polymerase subunit RPC12/RpoP
MNSPTCLACGGTMQAFTGKQGKPYATCTPCGAQFFVRSKQGVERFTARYGTPGQKGTAAPPATAPKTAPPAKSEPVHTPEGASGGKKAWDILDY